MMKKRWDNNVIDRTSLLYAEKQTEVLWQIQRGTVYDED